MAIMMDDKSYDPAIHELDLSLNDNMHHYESMKKPYEVLETQLTSHFKGNSELTTQLQESIDFANRLSSMLKK